MTRGLVQRYPGELPREATGFVGRGRELGALAGLLGAVRLVTVTGTAGVGKTRVALRAATLVGERFADGVCFAELGGLRDLDLLPHAVAASLGLPGQDARSGTDAVVSYLSERNVLLVLDTCEHVIGGCVPLVSALLSEAPGVTVLATSRQPLDMPGEHVFPLPPLPVPEPGDAGGDAVELFAQRAAAAVPGFTVSDANRCDVIGLCRRLDGIPLAIELAAVQLRASSLRALSGRLEHRFLTLAGGGRGFALALPHQQTLRTATQWSYDLCSPAERLLWARLSVFAGPFGIQGAQDICAGGSLDRADVLPALIGLVDKSVVLRPDEDEPRYRLLDTIREFGAERLADSGEQADVRGRHVSYFIGLAEDFGAHDKDGDQLARFRHLRGEHQNFRAALGYALGAPGAPGDARLAARLASALRPYWEISGLLREGRHWMDKILARFPGPSAERARLLLTRGVLAIFQGELSEAIADLDASTELSAAGGDALACALGHTYRCLAFVFSGRHAEAAAAGATAEERLLGVGHQSGLVSLDIHLGYLHLLSREPDLAIERCAQGLRRLDGGERWARSYLLVITALGLYLRGDTEASAVAAVDSLQMKDEIGDLTGMAYCLEVLAMLAVGQGRFSRTAWLLGAADTLWERTGKRLGGTAAIEGLHQRAENTARAGLGGKRYERLFGDGAVRERGEIVGLAIGDADKLPPATRGRLTKREREVAALAGEGLTSSQIAGRLFISSRTVNTHIASIYAKLGISSRVQLVTWLAAGPGRATKGTRLGSIPAMTQTGRRDALVVLLTAAAGATNVLSLTALGGVPASIMTANLVLVGLSITHHEGAVGWHAGAALAGFVVAVFFTSPLIRAHDNHAVDAERSVWPRPVTVAIAVEAVPLIGLAVAWGLTAGRPTGATQLTMCTGAALVMGIQSAAVRALGVAGLSSTFFTGTLTDTVRDLTGPGPLRWSAGASGLVALVAGAAAEGAVLTYGPQRLGPLLPLVLVCCVAALSSRGFSRGG